MTAGVNLGQGANQAIEDCGVLASLLTDITSKNEIEGVLKDYESIRKENWIIPNTLQSYLPSIPSSI